MATQFEILPAIDLRGGKCVRLYQGSYDRETVYSNDPAATARRWAACGAGRLHIVDLDGAAGGRPENRAAVKAIRSAVELPIQISGGIRTSEAVGQAIELGADRVIVGTAAVDNPEFLSEIVAAFGDAVVFSIDARDGRVATRGWKELTDLDALDVARDAARRGVRRLIFTDITQDGTLSGPNIPSLRRIIEVSGLPVIVAGGVASVEHIRAARNAGAAGAVVGRAIYDGSLDLAAAIQQLEAA